MKRLIKKSAKQVGTLYHFTNLNNLIRILKSDTLYSGVGNYICFTRDKNFNYVPRESISGTDCRITIDGDNLSNKYKIKPHHDQNWFNDNELEFGSKDMESEERINGNIHSIKSYIFEITLFKEKMELYYSDQFKWLIDGSEKRDYTIKDIITYIESIHGIKVNLE